MFREGDEVHVTTEEARAGATNVGLRYVLAISLALAIMAMSGIWIFLLHSQIYAFCLLLRVNRSGICDKY